MISEIKTHIMQNDHMGGVESYVVQMGVYGVIEVLHNLLNLYLQFVSCLVVFEFNFLLVIYKSKNCVEYLLGFSYVGNLVN